MKKTIEINGQSFELVKDAYKEVRYCSLYHAYNNPSYRKQQIYENWKDWTRLCNRCTRFGVHSRNSHFFTLTGTIIDNDAIYDFTITHSHNYISRRFDNE